MIATANTPRVYAACLASYNAGILHGEWIDLDQDPDDVRAEIADMLERSPEPGAEEWAIHDYDNMPDMGEWPDLDKLCAIGNAIADAEENGCGDAFRAWLDNEPYNLDNPDNFRDAFLGEYDSEKDYAIQYVEDSGLLADVPDAIAGYFDYDAYARDLFFDLDAIRTGRGTIFVFDR